MASKENVFTSKNMFLGETVRKGITISKSSGSLSIDDTTAVVTVYDASDNTVVNTEESCTVDDDDVYAYIPANETDGTGSRYAMITWVDGSHTGKARLNYNVVQG